MLLFEMMCHSVVWSTETSMPLSPASIFSEVYEKNCNLYTFVSSQIILCWSHA